jgi:hypothetical protein
MKTQSILLLVIFGSVNYVQAQQHAVVQWFATYNGPDHFLDVPKAATLDSHGNLYITGGTYINDVPGGRKLTTIRYSPSGQPAFYESYDSTTNGFEFGTSVAVDDSGAAYVAGISEPTDTSTEGVLIQYSTAGRIEWVTHYPVYALRCQVVLDAAGSIYLGISEDRDIRVWKLNRQGVILDSAFISGDTTNLYLTALVVTLSGDLFVVGNRSWATTTDNTLPRVHNEGEIVKMDAQCHILWESHPAMGMVSAARSDQHGDLAVIDANMVVKYSSDGQLLWHTVNDQTMRLTGLAIDSRSRVIVCGYGLQATPYNAIAKYDPDGRVLWTDVLPNTGSPQIQYWALALDSADNIYVTGNVSDGSPGVGCLTVKVDTSGRRIWETTFVRTIDQVDIGTFISVDDSANVHVAGQWGTTNNSGYLVIKYGQASGSDAVGPIRGIPSSYSLAQNFPNPFNPSTRISFSIAKEGPLSLRVYDILGREVATLVNENRKAGEYTEQFNGNQMASGVYMYVLKSSEGQLVGRMMLLK